MSFNVTEILALTKDLAVIPAPSGKEERRTAFCLNYWRERGLDAFADEVGNVILELGGKESSPAVLFMAHTDIVFDENAPLVLREEGDRLYCPGIGDDTVHAAFVLAAGVWMAEQKLPEDTAFLFAANVCEEGEGNLRGCKALMERYGDRLKEVVSFDSYLEKLHDTCVGSMRYRVTAKTAGGHSFRDFGAPNAIAKLCGLVAELEKQPLPKVGITTFNFGSISGGTTVNTIAAEASMLYEFRSDTKENFAQMEAQFQAACQGVKDCTLSVETIGVRPCGSVAEKKQTALIARCERAFAGLPVPARYPASTDCNLPLSMGIPAVCIGLVEGGGAHTLAEYIRPESIAQGADVLVRLLKSYL